MWYNVAMTIFEVPLDQAEEYGKTCVKCDEWCFWEEFYSDNNKRDGLRSDCKRCRKLYEKGHYEINKDNKQQYSRDYYNLNPLENAFRNRANKFGLTVESLQLLYEIQQHRCAWCGRHKDDLKYLCIDHDRGCCPEDRSCGKCVRRLLCDGCNITEGKLKHWPEALAALEALAWMPLDMIQSLWNSNKD